MKNSAGRGGCYPSRTSASVDNILRDLQNSSYSTQPHSIIALLFIQNIFELLKEKMNFTFNFCECICPSFFLASA